MFGSYRLFLSGILVFFIALSSVEGREKADAFIITAYDDRVKVLSPVRFQAKVSAIVQNKTLVKLLGRIENQDGKILAHLSIPPGSFRSVDLVISKEGKLFFVPVAPAFQKVELLIGAKVYEIPPAR